MSDDLEERGSYLEDAFSSGAPETSDAGEASDTSNSPDSSNASNTPNTQQADEAKQTDETTPVRERPTKLLYLEEDVKKDLELAFARLDLRYQQERDEELQQNVDWWPVLLQIGYEAIGDVSDLDLDEFDRVREDGLTTDGND